MVKIGILKTDAVVKELAAEFGEYPDMFQALLSEVDPQLQFATYDVCEGEYPPSLDANDAYLVTGSRASAYEMHDWIQMLMNFVRKLHQGRKKLLGICFGHQLVAQVLGGEVRRSDRGWGVGVHSAFFSELPRWHDQGDTSFRLLVSHQDQVIAPAPGSRTWASSDFCPHAVCQLGDHILTFQGHPEFVKGYAECLLEMRRDVLGEETYRQAKASLATPLDRKRTARWMLRFLRD